MKIQSIEDIRKKFHKEWLLIEVTEFDRSTSTSKSGRLIAHSPNRDTIYKKVLHFKSKLPTLIDYSQAKLPKDVAVIFYIYG